MPGRRFMLMVLLTVVLAAGAYVAGRQPKPLSASLSPASPPPTSTSSTSSPDKPHIAVVMMENKEDGDVLGSPEAPFLNSLAAHGATATNMYGVTHPSLPNYLALIGGSTYGITSDCTDCSASGPNLGTQLSAAGVSWKAYVEDYPGACDSGGDGYAKKHVPFLYFPSVTSSRDECAHIVPLSQLASDESSGRLPSFIWITPNLCHDMHNCSVSVGDTFLSQLLPPLTRALGPKGVMIVTWDEGSSKSGSGGGHIPFIMSGAGVQAGAKSGNAYDHYAVLRFLEERFGLSPLGQASSRPASSLTELLAK